MPTFLAGPFSFDLPPSPASAPPSLPSPPPERSKRLKRRRTKSALRTKCFSRNRPNRKLTTSFIRSIVSCISRLASRSRRRSARYSRNCFAFRNRCTNAAAQAQISNLIRFVRGGTYMAYFPRRRFLRNSLNAAAGCSATLLLRNSLFAQASPNATTRVYLDTRRALPPLDRNIFGSFLEHLGRAIYEGIYDPDSKLSDANGFRQDVADEIKKI